jgi:hypothetical protein
LYRWRIFCCTIQFFALTPTRWVASDALCGALTRVIHGEDARAALINSLVDVGTDHGLRAINKLVANQENAEVVNRLSEVLASFIQTASQPNNGGANALAGQESTELIAQALRSLNIGEGEESQKWLDDKVGQGRITIRSRVTDKPNGPGAEVKIEVVPLPEVPSIFGSRIEGGIRVEGGISTQPRSRNGSNRKK